MKRLLLLFFILSSFLFAQNDFINSGFHYSYNYFGFPFSVDFGYAYKKNSHFVYVPRVGISFDYGAESSFGIFANVGMEYRYRRFFIDLNYNKGNRKLLWERNEMSSKSDKEIMQKAINTYGLENQMIKTIEELAELSQSLSKALVRLNSKSDASLSVDLKSVDNIFEEMADVEIMLEQCEMMFKCETEVQNWKEKKIARLAERLKNE